MKLANVVIKKYNSDKYPQIKVTDFGFSTYFKPNKDGDKVDQIGSGIYKAPELFKASKINEKVDIWATGIMLFTMLAGNDNFPFETEKGVKKDKVSFDKNQFGREYFKRPPSPECQDFITYCLNKDFKTRHSAKQLLMHPWITSNT